MYNESHVENRFLKALDAIPSNNAPIVLYGSSELASRIYLYLCEQGISIDYVVVDARFCNGRRFFDFEITPIEELDERRQYNFIIAFETQNRDEVYSKIHHIAKTITHYDVGYGAPYNRSDIIYYENNFIEDNYSSLQSIRACLEDDLSRDTLDAFIRQRATGEIGSYEKYFRPDQYFPNDIVTIPENCAYVDCGAYSGDTVARFVDTCGKKGVAYSAIYAFEPNPEMFLLLEKNTKDYANCVGINKGVWNKQATMMLKQSSGSSMICSDGETSIGLDSLDAVLANAQVDFIKMDIEGAELPALQGAETIIKKSAPLLAVCVYHRHDDIVAIPTWIKKTAPEYRLYLRAHAKPMTRELVLYAMV